MNHGFVGRRKGLAVALTTALVALGATAGAASAATTTFSGGHVLIPDNQVAKPYPSTVNVSGVAGDVSKVTVTLQDFVHSCPDDIAVLLEAPSGANSMLMGEVGGCGDETPAIDVTFDQSAAEEIPDPLVAGTFLPTDATLVPFTPPAPQGPYVADLGVFNGPASGANGGWKLWVEDRAAADAGGIGDWQLKITAPFNTSSVGAPTLNRKNGTATVPVTVADAGNVSLSGTGVATVASKSVAVSGPSTVNLLVSAIGKKKKKLNRKGKVTVSPTITFTPTGGAAKSQTLTVQLQKKLKKKK